MINIRSSAAKLLKDDFQIEPEVTELMFEKGILNEPTVKKALIKHEYIEKVQPKERDRLKNKLAEKYCISVESVRKIVER